MDQDKFKILLLKISREMTQTEFQDMKFFLNKDIPPRRMEELETPTAIFTELENRDKLSPHNLVYLRKILASVSEGRVNLTSIIDQAIAGSVENRPANNIPRNDPNTGIGLPPSTYQNDGLERSINYLVKNLGRQWKRMCRYLPGISEPDLDNAKENYPRDLQEQIIYILRLWKTRNPTNCSKQVLIKACVDAELRLYAEDIEDLN